MLPYCSNPRGNDRDRTPDAYCSDEDKIVQQEKEDDSDLNDGKWSHLESTRVFRRVQVTVANLKTLPVSYRPAVKRKASTSLDDVVMVSNNDQ